MNSNDRIEIELGRPLEDIQRSTTVDLVPDPFRDDDAKFIRGPLSLGITSIGNQMSLSNVGFAGLRIIAGLVVSVDLNPHDTRLTSSTLTNLWQELSQQLSIANGFWLPGELPEFSRMLSQMTEPTQIDFPSVVHGLLGKDTLRVEVKPNDAPAYRSFPPSQWTYRLNLSVSNSRISHEAYEFAKQVRTQLGGDRFKPILISQYPDSIRLKMKLRAN